MICPFSSRLIHGLNCFSQQAQVLTAENTRTDRHGSCRLPSGSGEHGMTVGASELVSIIRLHMNEVTGLSSRDRLNDSDAHGCMDRLADAQMFDGDLARWC